MKLVFTKNICQEVQISSTNSDKIAIRPRLNSMAVNLYSHFTVFGQKSVPKSPLWVGLRGFRLSRQINPFKDLRVNQE